jgi:signal transduction histidine kinase
MGLGLSIVDRIVRNFSGFIKVESSPGLGACFYVHLPAHVKEE